MQEMQPEEIKIKKKPGPKPRASFDEIVSQQSQCDHNYETLKSMGLPCKYAIFHRAIRSWEGTPENALYAPDPKEMNLKKSRIAELWYTPHGLIWEAHNKRGIIPLANVSDARLI